MVTKVVNMSQILHKINLFKKRSHLGCNTNMAVLKDTKAAMYYGHWLYIDQFNQINRAHTSHINGSTRAQLTHSHFLFPLQKVKKSLQKKNPAKLPILHH